MHLTAARTTAALTLALAVQVLGSTIPPLPSKDVGIASVPTMTPVGEAVKAIMEQIKKEYMEEFQPTDEAALPQWEKELDAAVQELAAEGQSLVELTAGMDSSNPDATPEKVVEL